MGIAAKKELKSDAGSVYRYNLKRGGLIMNLQNYLDSRKMTKYNLSKISGVPKTTVIDICSGKSSLQRCSARTVQQLAKAKAVCKEESVKQISKKEQKALEEQQSFGKNITTICKIF